MALFTGGTFDKLLADPSCGCLVSDPEHVSAWVVSMPQYFTDTLAEANDLNLREVAGSWSKTEEFGGQVSAEDLFDSLIEWRGLAQLVRERGEHMYCWMSL